MQLGEIKFGFSKSQQNQKHEDDKKCEGESRLRSRSAPKSSRCRVRRSAYHRAPDNLVDDEIARTTWDAVTREMVAKNLYDEDCAHIVELYCIHRSRFFAARAQFTAADMVILSHQGRRIPNPWLVASNMAHDRMVKLASELGLTPVTRGRATKTRGSRTLAASKYLKSRSG